MPGAFYAGNKHITTQAPRYLLLTKQIKDDEYYYCDNLSQQSMANSSCRDPAMGPHQLGPGCFKVNTCWSDQVIKAIFHKQGQKARKLLAVHQDIKDRPLPKHVDDKLWGFPREYLRVGHSSDG